MDEVISFLPLLSRLAIAFILAFVFPKMLWPSARMTSQWKEWGPALARTSPIAIKSRSRASTRKRRCISAPMRSRTSGSQRRSSRRSAQTPTRLRASLAEPSLTALPRTGWPPPRTSLAALMESLSRSLCTWGRTFVCFAGIKLWTTPQMDPTLPCFRPTCRRTEIWNQSRWLRLLPLACQWGLRLPLPMSQSLPPQFNRSPLVCGLECDLVYCGVLGQQTGGRRFKQAQKVFPSCGNKTGTPHCETTAYHILSPTPVLQSTDYFSHCIIWTMFIAVYIAFSFLSFYFACLLFFIIIVVNSL